MNAIGPAVGVTEGMVSPTPSRSARAMCRGRQYRHRQVSVSVKYEIYWMVTSNKEDCSWIGQPVPEILASQKRHGVGLGRAAHTHISPLNHRRTHSALRTQALWSTQETIWLIQEALWPTQEALWPTQEVLLLILKALWPTEKALWLI